MSDNLTASTQKIPSDDVNRQLAIARPNGNQKLTHLGIVGDTYTILLTGEDTNGRFCLIDMFVPQNGGPPPHRHDFEETFTVLEGEIEITFRDEKSTLKSGETANIPANAPHFFTNLLEKPARLLCMCSPSGQEKFFIEVGVEVEGRTTAPPKLDESAQAELKAKSEALAPKYRTELLAQ